MATATAKKARNKKQKNTQDNLKSALHDLNSALINTSEDLIENAVKTGEKYQKLFAKSVKKTEPMMEKNVDLFFDTVEGLMDQAEEGTVRFKKLVGWNDKLVSKWRKRAEKNFNDLKKDVEETIEAVQTEIADRIPGMEQPEKKAATTAKKKAQKTTKKATATAKKAVRKTTKKASATAKKAVRKTTKKATATAKKAVRKTTKKATPTAKKVTKKPTTRVRAKKGLQVINGIGPKAEKILITAGFTTVEKIAKASVNKIEKAIEASGAPIRMDAKSWIAQAKKVAK